MTPIKANPETPASVSKPPIRLKFDAQGRAIPLTEAEHAAHREALRAALKRMAEVPDDDPGVPDEEIFRAIDEGRPHRPLFEGYY